MKIDYVTLAVKIIIFENENSLLFLDKHKMFIYLIWTKVTVLNPFETSNALLCD